MSRGRSRGCRWWRELACRDFGIAGRGWIIWYRARQSRGKPGVAVGRCAWLAAGHDLALLDRGDAVAEQGLAIEDLLQVASQLGLAAEIGRASCRERGGQYV